MSRESYARGFCKAAGAAGVDPSALAEFAQEFKINGCSQTKSASPSKHVTFLEALKKIASEESYQPTLRTNGKVPDSVRPPSYDKSRLAENVNHALDAAEPDFIPSVQGKGANGNWGVQQTARGIDDELIRALRRLDSVRRGGSIDKSGKMSPDEQKAWLNSHFRSLIAARRAIQRAPYVHAGNVYNGAMFANTNDFPAVIGNVDVK